MNLKFLGTALLLALSKACNHGNTEALAEPIIPNAIKTAFDNLVATEIKPHPAVNHPMFATIADMALTEGLTPEQFNRFREHMFSRVYTTVPSIAKLASKAIEREDWHTFGTAIKNLWEEGGEGSVKAMHPKLMEEAFNTLGKEVFGLPPATMKECYENSLLHSALVYRSTVEYLYDHQGPFVSYAQEFASGGDNSARNPGMMGNMYKLFYYYKPNMSPETFERHILPYFAAHISIDDTTKEQIFKGEAIEFHHGERARNDVLRQLKTAQDVSRASAYIGTFFDVQNNLFDDIWHTVEAAKTIGTPVRPALALSNTCTAGNENTPLSPNQVGQHVKRLQQQEVTTKTPAMGRR